MSTPANANPRDNLPRPLTAFIGRTQDLSALESLIRSARLLTLTGVGGCGKTRLAREVAARSPEAFPGGARWVELAPLVEGSEEALISQAIALAWGVAEQPGRPILETVVEALASEGRLLILDNCEHLLESCAWHAQFLLDGCPALTILTTSRQPLGIAGEVIFPVAPLPAPPEQRRYDLQELACGDAVSLFVARARAVAPSFALTEENVSDVARICRKLDGIPLALELAAARVRLLSVGQIADRLDNAFRVLGGGSRAAAPRQQTLRATLDWSYGLLSPAEASLLRRLAVFVGSFSLEAVEAICAGLQGEPNDILDELGRLVDKSLVLTQECAGTVRYWLLEVIRQYALEKLEASAEDMAARARHAEYYGQLAQLAGVDLDMNESRQWLDILEREHDNLRAAIGWALEHREPEYAGVIVAALWRFWRVRGYLAEGCRWLQLALARLPDKTLMRARALQALAILTYHHQGYAAAAPLVEEALALYQALNDRRGIAIALLNAGILTHGHGDYGRAMSYFEESLPLCSEVGWQHAIAVCLSSMGLTAMHLGDIPRAQALCTEGVLRAREVNDAPATAGALTNLGIALLLSQRYEQATARFEESLRLRREIADSGGVAHTLRFLGRAALELGDAGRAEAYYLESFALRDALGEDEGLAEALEGLAAVAAARGEGVVAAERLGAAEVLRERAGMPVPAIDRPFYEQWLTRIRDLLEEPALSAAWADGRLLTPREARDVVPTPAPEAPVATAASAVVDEVGGGVAGAVAPTPTKRPPAPAEGARPLLRIVALGDVRVYRGADQVGAAEWTYSRARELLFYLLSRDSATKEQIGLALWPEGDPAQLRAQLHPVLHHLRHALGRPNWVIFERGRYRFNRALEYTYDVEEFEQHLEQARRSQRAKPADAMRSLEQGLRLYRGDFLAGEVESEWADRRREELRRRYRAALLTLGHLYGAAGAHTRAADAYRRLIADDPFQERAHRELMRCLARLGERGQALRVFEELVALLNRELGAAPAPETTALAERVRRGETV
jgi:predicted ATPase/DNA-binding SARP family transcriptional activator